MTRKKISSRLYLLLVCAMLLPLMLTGLSQEAEGVTQYEIDQLEQKKDDIASQKDEVQGRVDELQAEQDNIVAQKLALDEKNELTRQEIVLINEQIDIYEILIEEKSKELDEAIELEEYQKERLRMRMRAMEENGSLGYLSFVVQSNSFADLLMRIDNITDIMEHDSALEAQYIAARENTELVKSEYEAVQEQQLLKRDELEQREAQLEAEIEQAQELIVKLEENIDQYREEFDKYTAMEQELIDQIAQMLKDLHAQEQALGGGNIASTGTYIWPLPGYSPGSAYGWRMHPIYHEMRFHAGEDIGAPSGTPILAADSGTVILAGVNGGYGNCVMINHGGGRVTLYAHQSTMAVSVGQSVTQGQVIGYVGSTGASTGPHLHFEVHVNGSTTAPKSYFNFG